MTIPLKAWVIDEAARSGVKPITIYHRLMRGKYPHVPLERRNQRVVLVKLEAMNDWLGLGPVNDAL